MFPSYEVLRFGRTDFLCNDLATSTIDMGVAKPVKRRYYPVSPKIEEEFYKENSRMLKLGVIFCNLNTFLE